MAVLHRLWTNERVLLDFLPLMVRMVNRDSSLSLTDFLPPSSEMHWLTRPVFAVLCLPVLQVTGQRQPSLLVLDPLHVLVAIRNSFSDCVRWNCHIEKRCG